MKAHRSINLALALQEARAGTLRAADLRKVIKIADELGKTAIVDELKRCGHSQRTSVKTRTA